jgi:hypothetical protein
MLGVAPDSTRGDERHGPGQQVVLDRPQRREHLGRIGGVRQLDRALQQDRPAVHLAGLDVVHGHAEHLRPVRERLLDRAQPGERGQQRRVHVDDAPDKALEEHVVEDRHVAGEDDEPDLALLEPVRDRGVALAPPRELAALEDRRLHARRPRALECPRRRLVGRDPDDVHRTTVHAVEQRLEVRALARGEHADPHAARASATTRSFG